MLSKLGTYREGSSRGFTLSELMFVVLMLGILGALVFPRYRQFVRSAHKTEINTVAYGAKRSIDAFLNERGRLPSTLAEVDLSEHPDTELLEQMVWENRQLILKADAASLGMETDEELTLIYKPEHETAEGTGWTCEVNGPPEFAPPGCD